MWDFFETVRHRHSVRKYLPDCPVEKEKLHAILEMACAAPSAGDLQSYQIHVVTNKDMRLALRKAAGNQSFVSEAPVCLVFSADTQRAATEYGERGEQLFAVQDASISATYAQLAVVAAGMGSTWVGQFDDLEVARLLKLRAGCIPIAIICLGYPAELPDATPRRRMNEVVHHLD